MKFGLLVIAAISICTGTSFSSGNVLAANDASKNILIIGTKGDDSCAYHEELDAITNYNGNIGLHYECFDNEKYESLTNYGDDFCDYISNQTQFVSEIDGVVVLNTEILNFILEHNITSDELFYEMPTIFIGPEDGESDNLCSQSEWVVNANKDIDYSSILSVIHDLMPKAITLNYITDDTVIGRKKTEQFLSDLELYDYEVNEINTSKLDLAEIETAVESCRSDEPTFLISFSKDENNNKYGISEICDALDGYVHSPLFSESEDALGKIALGGHYIDYSQLLTNTLNAFETYFNDGSAVFNDSVIDDIEIVKDFQFSQKMMEKYDLSISDLPAETTIIDPVVSAWDENRKAIYIAILIFAFILLMIIGLTLFRNEQKKKNLKIKKLNEKLEKQLLTDGLTGLKNGLAFSKDIEKYIERDVPFFVGTIVINEFSKFCIYYGRSTGDTIIKVVGKYLQMNSLDSVTIYALGGNEFGAIILRDNSQLQFEVNDDMPKNPSINYKVNNVDLFITWAIGLAEYPKHGLTQKDLIACSKYAIAYGDRMNDSGISMFDAEKTTPYIRGVEITEDLHKAIEKQLFYNEYKPLIDLKTGDIVSINPLLRIKGSEDISFGQLLEIASKTSFVNEISNISVDLNVAFLAKMKKLIKRKVFLGMSIIPVQINDLSLWKYISKKSDEFGISVENFLFMFDESIEKEDEANREKFFEFVRKIDATLCFLNFGEGYSCYNMLYAVPLGLVKVNENISNKFCEENNLEEAKLFIDYIHKLGIKVAFEGIDTIKQAKFSVAVGVDYARGLYFSKVLNEEEMLASLDKNYSNLLNFDKEEEF